MDIVLILAAALVSAAAVAFYFMTRQRSAGEELVRVTETARALEAQLAAAQRQLAERDDRLSAANERLLSANNLAAQERAGLTAEIASLKTREAEYRKQLEDKAGEIAALHEKLKVEFENIAGRILKDSREQLTADSKEKLDVLLTPVKERFEAFQKKVEEASGKGSEQHVALATLIEQLHQTHTTLHEDTGNLTRALKGESQTRGQWGERRLESLLQQSGLKEGENYSRQMSLEGESGERLRPDIVIRIPQDNKVTHIVIDSKVSLVDYLSWSAAAVDSDAKFGCEKAFLASIRGHINDLGKKKYQDNGKLIAHDYVLMFLPNEAMFSSAIDLDASLFDYAWERRVALVGPTTLMMTLNVVSSVWRLDRQQRNANDIFKEAERLHEQWCKIVDAFNSVDNHLKAASKAHAEAVHLLGDGAYSVARRVENIRKIGLVKGKREMPAFQVEGVALDGGKSGLEFIDDGGTNDPVKA